MVNFNLFKENAIKSVNHTTKGKTNPIPKGIAINLTI